MPLHKKGGRKCVAKNIQILEEEGGRPHKQNVAIAHKACGMSKKTKRKGRK